MKSNELRIGNKVNLFGSVATVQRADFSNSEHGIAIDSGKPIPLTEEWLLRFELGSDYELVRDINSDGYYFSITVYMDSPPSVYVRHVHQLQNLYFALTGKELKIKTK